MDEREDEVVVTKNGRPAAIIINIREYERLLETLETLSDPETMRQIRESEAFFAPGRKGLSLDEVFGEAPVKPRKQKSLQRG